ncbi:glutaredoxin family protein [Candidatus Wolfebacteria bacterium]|nr:glutaredoxin family protein [Candidatus Wolfebacteria bacterium]
MKNVTIYSTPTCHFCHAAKEFFKENNIAFTDYDVSGDAEKRNEMLQKSGQMGVPVIFVGDPSSLSGQAEMVVGFDEARLKTLLGIG